MERTAESAIIAMARSVSDTETPTPDTDHISDQFLKDHLKIGYKKLVDLVLSASGEAGITAFAAREVLPAATLGEPGVIDLPDQVHRVIDLRRFDGNSWAPLPTANWRTRHRSGSEDWPVYTAVQDKIRFDPPVSSVPALELWFIPTLAYWGDLDYLTVNGWDEYLVAYLQIKIAEREETSTSVGKDALKEAEQRIRTACRDLKMGHTKTLAQVESYAEDYFGWR